MVRQFSAIAGWLTYYNPLAKQRQYFRTALPTSEHHQFASQVKVESEEFLHRLTHQAREVQPNVWEFSYQSPTVPATIYGLKFQDGLSPEWAYLLLWVERPLVQPQPLLLGLDIVRRSLVLDQQQARHRQQAEQCQQILRRIEHQLRNPLAVIHLYAANLHESLQSEQDRLQADAIQTAVQHLSDHLTELIAGCQRIQVSVERCDVQDLFAEVWQGLQLSAQAKQVHLTLPSQPLHIMADRAQLLQGFENLLSNALSFSPPQGNVNVQWQLFRQEVLITIADQGPGLTPADMQHMFRPYYSNRPQGSGLGLTIARQIVQDHGGKIWADNLPTGGAQFSLVLPRHPPLGVRDA
ncbi:HAMP domain-containing sensor histidine kinase [Nodosilinea sp. E11]|uniref:sensor histidine kinase n=1 Tax=Nodosilinea sp. E11 TaxID=3037479 RepID=UPI002935246A|nr:HAMP domain-containing sensor histidine kinase [Nodosilinea sp. E11]